MVSYWSLSEGKSPQVFRNLLSILDDLNNAIVWMVSTRALIPPAPLTILWWLFRANWLKLMLPSFSCSIAFFSFLAISRYLSLFSFYFNFTQWSAMTAKSTIRQAFLFLSTIPRSSRLAEIRWSVCISKSQRTLRVSFSRTDYGLCICHLLVLLNFSFLHNSQWIPFPTKTYLVLYSFLANLLFSLIMWLIVSSLSPHNLHLIFYCVLCIISLIWAVLMALFSAAIRKDSVSLS